MDKLEYKKLADEFDEAFLKWQKSANSTADKNVRALYEIMGKLSGHCQNPFCGFPIKKLRDEDWSSPDYGDICATCHGALAALGVTNIYLKNYLYFRRLHEQWKKEEAEQAANDKQKRRRLGLDGYSGGF